MPEHDHGQMHPPTQEFVADGEPETGFDGRPIWHIMMGRVTSDGEDAVEDQEDEHYWDGYKWAVTIMEMPEVRLVADSLFEGRAQGIALIVASQGEDVHIHAGVHTPPSHRIGADLLDYLNTEVSQAITRFKGAHRALSHHLVDQLDLTDLDATFLMGEEDPEDAVNTAAAREDWHLYAMPDDDVSAMEARLGAIEGDDDEAVHAAISELVQFFFYGIIVGHPSVLAMIETMNSIFENDEAAKYLMFLAGDLEG